jgi:quercetin dioxygenase-like cupin family protein
MPDHVVSHRLTRRAIAPSAVLVAALALVVGAAAGQPEPITARPLIERHSFAGEVSLRLTRTLDGLKRHEVEMADASSLAVMEFTIQPGAVFPWHTHPGTVLVSLAEGELDFIFAADCAERRLSPGTAIVDPGNEAHTARNPGDVPTVVIATLLGAPAEGGLTLPVEAGEAAALDERCGIETPGAHAAGHGG